MSAIPRPAASPLACLEGEYLRPYRPLIALGLAGLFAQSLLLLPIAPLQGWVLDHLVPLAGRGRPIGPAEAAEASRVILLGLAASAGCIVAAMPMGLETPVGERGLSLSGGQRQRLALARAIVADPAVLLLDDCTSALDAETEARVQLALAEARPGRTTLIVSHKVASVRRADRILVLDGGRVVEQGTHDELLALGGLYADTFSRQTRVLAA